MVVRPLRVLLLCAVAAADRPQFLSFTTQDLDDTDRVYSNGDVLKFYFMLTDSTVPFIPDADGAEFPLADATGTAFSPDRALDKSAVDALLSFSVSLGADYTGEWSKTGPLVQFQVMVHNTSGADFAQLNSWTGFNVSCVPGQIQLVSGGTGFCESSEVLPDSRQNWGRGRPAIAQVTSNSTTPHLLLAAGDEVIITFDQPVDLPRIASDRRVGALDNASAAYVDALFAMDAAVLGSAYRGEWLSPYRFRVTLLDPPPPSAGGAAAPASNGALDYAIGCAPNNPLYLGLTAADLELGTHAANPSATCCVSGSTSCDGTHVRATGSFGALPAGPTIAAVRADDADDADDVPGRMSVGDTMVVSFTAPTSQPMAGNAASMFDFFLDGLPFAEELGLTGNWTNASTLVLTVASVPASGSSSLPLEAVVSGRLAMSWQAHPRRASNHEPATSPAPPHARAQTAPAS